MCVIITYIISYVFMFFNLQKKLSKTYFFYYLYFQILFIQFSFILFSTNFSFIINRKYYILLGKLVKLELFFLNCADKKEKQISNSFYIKVLNLMLRENKI